MSVRPPYYAVISTYSPPTMQVIASGPRDFCAFHLTRWIKDHPLADDQTAELLYRQRKIEPTKTFPSEVK